MLVSFSVENFRSFKEEAVLNLVADDSEMLRENHVFTPELENGVESFDLVRSAVIYGPNAGGKSNFFKALSTMEFIIRNSSKGLETLPVTPFILNEQTKKSPTTFEVVIVVDGIRYQYGFSFTQKRIHGEWLLAFPRDTKQTWFERTYNEKTEEYDYAPSKFLKGRKEVWQQTTSSKALFLSTAVNFNSKQLQPIYDWFAEKSDFISADEIPPLFSFEYYNEHGGEKLVAFLRTADFAIEGLEVKETDFSSEHIPKELATFFADQIKGQKHFNAETIHKTEEGNLVNFQLSMESDGTQRMFAIAPLFLETLEKGHILVIDELNQRLHPYLIRYLVGLFNNSDTNPKNAQLIFTTHAVSLLKKDIFRRDQIWFCERKTTQATTLFTLNEFEEHTGFEDFEAYYMSGRYGALPIIGDFSDLIDKTASD